MDVLATLAKALAAGMVEVVGLVQPLEAATPVLSPPAQAGRSVPVRTARIAVDDDRGPAWAWHHNLLSEHTGAHLDAPALAPHI